MPELGPCVEIGGAMHGEVLRFPAGDGGFGEVGAVHNYRGHNHIGHNYVGHTYVDHNYIGHSYAGHHCVAITM